MTLRIWFNGIAGAALVVASVGGQTPAPPLPAGLIMGVVVDSSTNKPVPAATVTIGSNRVKADDDGRFVFIDLARGYYAIDATKAGYLDGAYGRTRPDGASATLALGPDERVSDLRISLFRWAAISGQVVDEASEPVVGAAVEVLAKTWIGGRLVLERAGSAVTDDRGSYRVGALGAGDFVVATVFESIPVVKSDGDFIYAVHYYPGGTAVDQAMAVPLRVGEDRTGIDIQLRLSAASRVSGVLRSPSGAVAGPVVLTTNLNNLTAGIDLEAADVMSEPSGFFTFLAVPSGSYIAKSIVRPPPVRADNSTAPTRLMWATAPFSVDGTDINNLEVQLRPGFRIAGRFVFEPSLGGRGLGVVSMRGVTATIESLDVDTRALGDAVTLTVDTSGSFSSKELPPGRYFIRVENPPAGWTLKRINASGRDISNGPIRLDSDVTGLTFSFTDRPTDLSGFVRDDRGALEGATVLVFPRSRAAWNDFGRKPLGIRASRSSRDGSFRFAGLPPGDYYVVAVDDAAAVDWQQPRRLELFTQSATSVTLSDGDKRAVELRPAVIR